MDNVYEATDRMRVDPESVLARLADWHAHAKSRPVAGIGLEADTVSFFVADEVLIDGKDVALADELQRRYGAEVVPEPPLPPRPAEFRSERRVDLRAMPVPLRLRFPSPPKVGDVGRVLAGAAAPYASSPREIVVTSEFGAAVAAVVARHVSEGRSIGLNLFGETLAMPLTTAREGAAADPFLWNAFAGRSRMVQAWQLVDSIRQVRGDRFTTVGILDSGFWLDSRGVPIVPAGQTTSDFSRGFIQVNLQNESQAAGGRSTNGGNPWHGNGVASAATAVVANSIGAAGSGGTVAIPVFLQTDISVDQMMRAARICAAWGIDVLNMSVGFWGEAEIYFNSSLWNAVFQFASDNGVVMIAAAGNSLDELPDDTNLRPATRTPGVLTIGALDANDNAWIGSTPGVGSNFGSSVWLWAPGTSIPVIPDGNPANAAGSTMTGTSLAAPVVAGVAAMMRFANSGLSADDIRRILVDTGWTGAGRVTRGLDAYGAVLEAIRHSLPDTDEPNDTVARAAALLPIGSTDAIGPPPNGFTARSSKADPDYWKFQLDGFSMVIVQVDWYENLSSLFVAVEADDPDAHGIEQMTTSGGATTGRFVTTGVLPPGGYRIRVGGDGLTVYRLQVRRPPSPLAVDIFEDNDSFARAPRLFFEALPVTSMGVRTFGPGTYDATLHLERVIAAVGVGHLMNDDYFRLEVPDSGASVLRRAAVSVHQANEPVDVTLYDAAQEIIRAWTAIRSVTIHPPGPGTCYLKVTGSSPTRYQISTSMKADPATVPGPVQEELEILPKWWGDPSPLYLTEVVTHYMLDVNLNRGDGDAVAFEAPDQSLRLELLDRAGAGLRQAEPMNNKLFIDTRGLEPGPYLLRVTKQSDRPSGVVELRTAPPLR